MIVLEHIQQINDGKNWKCGSVSLEMLFKHYGIACNQDEVWESIKSPRPQTLGHYYALTADMSRYAIENGLDATIYKADADSWATVLDNLDKKGIPAILSLKEKKSGLSHFMVYIGKKDGDYAFADPNCAKAVSKYSYMNIREMWAPNDRIGVTGYIYVVFEGDRISKICPNCKKQIPILTKDRQALSPRVICPYCDSLMSIEDTI